jgi:hypothetical protein
MKRIFTLTFFALVLACSLFALTPGVPVQSGSSILVPLVPSDDPGSTVLLVTSTIPDARIFIVRYVRNGAVYERSTSRTGSTPQSLAVLIVRAPLSELSQISVQALPPGAIDTF